MKYIVASLLAMAASASFAAAPTANLNHDPQTYRNVTQKAAADYKAAVSTCSGASGNARDVCLEEAKAARAHAEADALAKYNNTPKGREKARIKVADADFALAKTRCAGMSAADKDDCMLKARSEHTAAITDAKADRGTLASNEASRAAMLKRCEQQTGKKDAACLMENEPGSSIARRTERAAETIADKTSDAARTAVEKTRSAAEIAADKTRAAGAVIAQKTDRATERTTDTAANAGERAAATTSKAVADTAITTKVKANIFKEPDLSALAIHVETEKGVVMLSGFVESKAEAEKAERLARSVDGVAKVRSALVVK
jgi:hyperosmotically inducible protein